MRVKAVTRHHGGVFEVLFSPLYQLAKSNFHSKAKRLFKTISTYKRVWHHILFEIFQDYFQL